MATSTRARDLAGRIRAVFEANVAFHQGDPDAARVRPLAEALYDAAESRPVFLDCVREAKIQIATDLIEKSNGAP